MNKAFFNLGFDEVGASSKNMLISREKKLIIKKERENRLRDITIYNEKHNYILIK